jgi:hypothetical protein
MRLTTCLISLTLYVGCVTEKSEVVPEHLEHIENLIIYPENPTPAAEIELIREISFGETDEVFFGRMVENIAVDHSGLVFIADLPGNTIHIYDSDGSYLQNIGREGQGPGEFQAIWDLKVFDGKIHVLDYQHFKISVFDLDTFGHVRDYDISLQIRQNNQPTWINWTREEGLMYRPVNLFVRTDNTYLLLFSDDSVGSAHNVDNRTYEASVYNSQTGEFTEHDLLSFKWTGQVLVHEEGVGLMVLFRVPYKRSSQFDFSNDQFVHGWTEEMLFKFYDRNSVPQRAYYYPYSNAQLHSEDVIMYFEDAGEQVIHAIRSDDHPETWPAFHSLKLDDENRLWVSTIVDDQEIYEWWVLDEAGELIATFSWPRNRDLKQVKNSYAYTMERDMETGLQEVVRYKINIRM